GTASQRRRGRVRKRNGRLVLRTSRSLFLRRVGSFAGRRWRRQGQRLIFPGVGEIGRRHAVVCGGIAVRHGIFQQRARPLGRRPCRNVPIDQSAGLGRRRQGRAFFGRRRIRLGSRLGRGGRGGVGSIGNRVLLQALADLAKRAALQAGEPPFNRNR